MMDALFELGDFSERSRRISVPCAYYPPDDPDRCPHAATHQSLIAYNGAGAIVDLCAMHDRLMQPLAALVERGRPVIFAGLQLADTQLAGGDTADFQVSGGDERVRALEAAETPSVELPAVLRPKRRHKKKKKELPPEEAKVPAQRTVADWDPAYTRCVPCDKKIKTSSRPGHAIEVHPELKSWRQLRWWPVYPDYLCEEDEDCRTNEISAVSLAALAAHKRANHPGYFQRQQEREPLSRDDGHTQAALL